MRAGGYEHDIAALIEDYRASWVIRGTATGYSAQPRAEHGHGRGPALAAPSLDELAGAMDRAADAGMTAGHSGITGCRAVLAEGSPWRALFTRPAG